MTLRNYTNTNRWLFIGLSGLPGFILTILMTILIIASCVCGSRPNHFFLAWAISWYAIPIWATVVGFLLAYGIAHILNWQSQITKNSRLAAYQIIFSVLWSIVISFLLFLVFAFGMGDAPPATSYQEYTQRIAGVVFLGFPEATLIALGICSAITAAVVLLVEGIVSVFRL